MQMPDNNNDMRATRNAKRGGRGAPRKSPETAPPVSAFMGRNLLGRQSAEEHLKSMTPEMRKWVGELAPVLEMYDFDCRDIAELVSHCGFDPVKIQGAVDAVFEERRGHEAGEWQVSRGRRRSDPKKEDIPQQHRPQRYSDNRNIDRNADSRNDNRNTGDGRNPRAPRRQPMKPEEGTDSPGEYGDRQPKRRRSSAGRGGRGGRFTRIPGREDQPRASRDTRDNSHVASPSPPPVAATSVPSNPSPVNSWAKIAASAVVKKAAPVAASDVCLSPAAEYDEPRDSEEGVEPVPKVVELAPPEKREPERWESSQQRRESEGRESERRVSVRRESVHESRESVQERRESIPERRVSHQVLAEPSPSSPLVAPSRPSPHASPQGPVPVPAPTYTQEADVVLPPPATGKDVVLPENIVGTPSRFGDISDFVFGSLQRTEDRMADVRFGVSEEAVPPPGLSVSPSVRPRAPVADFPPHQVPHQAPHHAAHQPPLQFHEDPAIVERKGSTQPGLQGNRERQVAATQTPQHERAAEVDAAPGPRARQQQPHGYANPAVQQQTAGLKAGGRQQRVNQRPYHGHPQSFEYEYLERTPQQYQQQYQRPVGRNYQGGYRQDYQRFNGEAPESESSVSNVPSYSYPGYSYGVGYAAHAGAHAGETAPQQQPQASATAHHQELPNATAAPAGLAAAAHATSQTHQQQQQAQQPQQQRQQQYGGYIGYQGQGRQAVYSQSMGYPQQMDLAPHQSHKAVQQYNAPQPSARFAADPTQTAAAAETRQEAANPAMMMTNQSSTNPIWRPNQPSSYALYEPQNRQHAAFAAPYDGAYDQSFDSVRYGVQNANQIVMMDNSTSSGSNPSTRAYGASGNAPSSYPNGAHANFLYDTNSPAEYSSAALMQHTAFQRNASLEQTYSGNAAGLYGYSNQHHQYPTTSRH